MIDLAVLAWRYLLFHRGKSILLVAGLTVALALPMVVRSAVSMLEEEMFRRAEATPVVVGARGSRFDLALHALNFRTAPPGFIPQSERRELEKLSGLRVLPLHARFTARGFPVVGTTLDYFDFRGLEIVEGHGLVRLGDAVLGAEVAARLEVSPGDWLRTDRENFFDLAGTQPLELRVVGMLAPSDSPDDRAVLVDLRTAWILEGIGHGHDDVAQELDEDWVLEREEDHVRSAPVIPTHQRITSDNLHTFHFHGEPGTFPLTAVLVDPVDDRSRTLLLGRYAADDSEYQALRPPHVVAEIMEMVIRLKRFFDWHHLFLIGVTVLFIGLVMMLSLRLRKAEITTMIYLGCRRGTILTLQLLELGSLLVVALGAAMLVNWASRWLLAGWIQTLSG